MYENPIHNVLQTNAAGEEVVYSYPKAKYSDPNRKDGRRKEKRKGWQVAEMWDNHHEIARRLVLGQSNVGIAEELGVTVQQVSNVKNSPVVQDKLSILHATRDIATLDLRDEIASLAPIAVKRIREALETGAVMGKELSGTSILKEANGILDREMGKAIQRVDSRNVNTHLSLEDLDRIKERARSLSDNSN